VKAFHSQFSAEWVSHRNQIHDSTQSRFAGIYPMFVEIL